MLNKKQKIIKILKNHRHLRIAILILGGIFGLLVLFFLVVVRPYPVFNANKVPKIITANFIDLDRVYAISRYRSGAGHDYSVNGETCRSMKHYFNIGHNTVNGRPVRTKPTAGHPDINIYAPFSGLIYSVGGEHSGLGKQVSIMARSNIFYDARIFHVDLLPGIHSGSFVKSGQRIATIGPEDGTDIAIEAGGFGGIGQYGVSYFAAMTDKDFEPYAKLGYQRSDFIISKAYRDAHPLQCSHDNNDSFVNSLNRPDLLDDYIHLKPDAFDANIPRGPGAPEIHYGPPAR